MFGFIFLLCEWVEFKKTGEKKEGMLAQTRVPTKSDVYKKYL